MKERTVYGIALDGNGNPERACQVEASGPVKTSFTVEEVEDLRDDIISELVVLRDQRADVSRSAAISVRYSQTTVEEKFSALLSKIKN